jgi:hypothetical protein
MAIPEVVRKARKALMKFAKDNGHSVQSLNHVHPRAFFVGYAAPKCGIFKQNYLDSQPHNKEFTRQYPYQVIHNTFYDRKEFDESLKEGDACYMGYISTASYGTIIACSIPKEDQ